VELPDPESIDNIVQGIDQHADNRRYRVTDDQLVDRIKSQLAFPRRQVFMMVDGLGCGLAHRLAQGLGCKLLTHKLHSPWKKAVCWQTAFIPSFDQV
jgi:hypothetical protein